MTTVTMKRSLLAAAIASCLTVSVDGSCSFCSQGLTVDGSTAVPNSGGQDCASLLEFAPSLEADEFLCDASKEAESLCCPGGGEPDQPDQPEEPDQPEPNQPEPDQPEPDQPDQPENVDVPEEQQPGEEVPPETEDTEAEEEACVVCGSGLTVPETTSYDGRRTCAQVLLDAAATTADTNRCNNIKQAEGTCCPPPAEDPCQFCADGLTVGEDTAVGQVTCGQAKADAAITESDSNRCGRIQSLEETCCPGPASDPCPVCPDGLTVDEYTVISEAQGTTCGGLISDALNVESDSNTCDNMLGAEELCCPAESDGCPVCVDGLTVDESTVLDEGRGRTCATLLEDALETDPDSNRCNNMKRSEAVCCPPPAEDPCPVCPGGITVDGTTPVTDERTCDNLVSDAMLVESDDDVCESMLGLMETCCPEGSEAAAVATDAPVAPAVTTDAPVASPVAATDAPAAATGAPVAVPAAAEAPELPASSPAPSFLAASASEGGATPTPVAKVSTPAPSTLRGAATDAPFAVAGGDLAVLPGGDAPSAELPGIEFGGGTPIEAPPAPSGGVRRTAAAAGGAAAALLWSLAQFA